MSKQKYPQTSTSTATSSTGTLRKGRDHYSHAKLDAKKDRKRQEADARQHKYDALTLDEKIKGLDKDGSHRQFARLTGIVKKPVPVVKGKLQVSNKINTSTRPVLGA